MLANTMGRLLTQALQKERPRGARKDVKKDSMRV